MPQASQETIDAWPHSQEAALTLLETNFFEDGGWFHRKDSNYQMTEEEGNAIQYLIEEWDYGWGEE